MTLMKEPRRNREHLTKVRRPTIDLDRMIRELHMEKLHLDSAISFLEHKERAGQGIAKPVRWKARPTGELWVMQDRNLIPSVNANRATAHRRYFP
jgi:hypothetical protein